MDTPIDSRRMPSKPLLLVDVDGVLNPWAAKRCPDGFTEHFFPPHEEPARLNPLHGVWLRRLGRVYDMAWATGWGDEANELLPPILGIAEMPVVRFPAVPFEPAEKVPAVAAYSGERAVAWIDDALGQDAWLWYLERQFPTLLVPIDPAIGLTEDVVERLEEWDVLECKPLRDWLSDCAEAVERDAPELAIRGAAFGNVSPT